jgi:uncharacterized protein
VPESLELDEHSGSSWLSLTPFVVDAARIRGVLPVPRISQFLQLNVRTYVTRDGKPGIWFLSLDASSWFAVEAGRRLYRVPFFHTSISFRRRAGRRVFESARADGTAFTAEYAPAGETIRPEPGSLESFLTERYCMYAEHEGGLLRGEIHHLPWQLRPAEADIELNAMSPGEVHLGKEPVLHYSAREDVLLWPLEGVD